MATLTRQIGKCRASDVRRFRDMGWLPRSVVPENIKLAAIQPARYEPVMEET